MHVKARARIAREIGCSDAVSAPPTRRHSSASSAPLTATKCTSVHTIFPAQRGHSTVRQHPAPRHVPSVRVPVLSNTIAFTLWHSSNVAPPFMRIPFYQSRCHVYTRDSFAQREHARTAHLCADSRPHHHRSRSCETEGARASDHDDGNAIHHRVQPRRIIVRIDPLPHRPRDKAGKDDAGRKNSRNLVRKALQQTSQRRHASGALAKRNKRTWIGALFVCADSTSPTICTSKKCQTRPSLRRCVVCVRVSNT
jgi:hypothetical protein